MAKKIKEKIDLTQKRTSIQCFCFNDTPENRGAVIGAKDGSDCNCIMIDGQGLGDSVRVDRAIVSIHGSKTSSDRDDPPFISTRTLKGVRAGTITHKNPKFISLEKFKIN